MKSILITGESGFVGSNLVRTMQKKYSLGLLSRHPNCLFSWGELGKLPKEEFDVVIHLAGKAHDTKDISKKEEYFEVNTQLTARLFDFFLSSSATTFIFLSSVKAVADTVEGVTLKEDVIPMPVGPYGESKLAAEQYIQSKDYSGKRVYILRPCMIHGQNNKGNLNLLYNFVRREMPYPLGAFENKRSFLSVDNLCYIIQSLIDNEVESGIYNVADDVPLSTNELISIIADELKIKKRIWKVPMSLIRTLSKCGDALHLPFRSSHLRKLTENYVVSNEKIKRALGISSFPISSEVGIRKTIRSFLK